MNIVILHCHYQRGGVTQVVQNQVRALRMHDQVDKILLVGSGRTDGLSPDVLSASTLIRVDSLEYEDLGGDDLGGDDLDGDDLAGDKLDDDKSDSSVTDAARSNDLHVRLRRGAADRAATMRREIVQSLADHQCDPQTSVLHWHNHSLGKNSSIPAVIGSLAAAGWRQLLQIHDFAEDNRPTNYRKLIESVSATDLDSIDRYLYPTARQIHYATLTRADQSVLEEIGIPRQRSHWLPNCVAAPQVGSAALADSAAKGVAISKVRAANGLPSEARWVLYPVRGIRRKNLGEFLLLSRWTDPNCFAGITLRPTTAIEQRSYDRWRSIADEVAPRAVFDAAAHDELTFSDNMLAADFVISTSVAEGFGMTYLEPWLSGREVIARRLATVTDDFGAAGVRIEKLYERIPIPGSPDWVGQCRREYESSFARAWEPIPADFRPPNDGCESSPGEIDFALLSPARQIEVLSRLSQDAGFERACRELSARLVSDLNGTAEQIDIDHNRSVIESHYSVGRAGQTLIKIYDPLMRSSLDSEIHGPSNAGEAVAQINADRPFFPCRTEVI